MVIPALERPNQKWSMDFVTDSIVTGRRFRALAIVDDYSRECPAIELDTSLGGARVVRVLERLADIRGLPEVITVDNGPEFASRPRYLSDTYDGWPNSGKRSVIASVGHSNIQALQKKHSSPYDTVGTFFFSDP